MVYQAGVSVIVGVFSAVFLSSTIIGQSDDQGTRIRPGSRVFVAPMDGFETFLTAAMSAKKVPMTVVTNREHADYEVVGTASSERPGAIRTLLRGETGTDEEASIAMKNVRSGVVVFAYSVHLKDSFRGRQSAAESCAKHLKDRIDADAKQPFQGARDASSPVRRDAARSNGSDSLPTLPTRSLRVVIQGDWTEQDFLGELRKAFAGRGVDLQVLAAGATDYAYNIVLTFDANASGPAASAIMLDPSGKLVASAARSGFRQKGAVSGCASELADRMLLVLGPQ